MIFRRLLVLTAVPTLSATAYAQDPAAYFEKAVYVTCREAQAMPAETRRALAVYLAEHSARFRGVTIHNDDRGAQIAYLVRGGCTLAPDAYLFSVIDRAILAEMSKLPKR
jgi:hypothetical protein